MLAADVSLACAAAAVAVMGTAWALSVPLRDASVADVAWGPALAAVAWAAWAFGERPGRSLLLAVLVSAWALRLALHIGLRNRGHGEDRRYAAMRDRHGPRFALRSLWSVFALQAACAWVIALPLQSAAVDASPSGIGALALAGAAIALAGLAFEATADEQLRRFLAAGGSGVMDRGVWSWSRHPNYFGETAFWWATWLIALEAGSPWWTLAGPVFLTFLLLRVSGVALLERSIESRRPGYDEYAARVSAFIPRPPRG